MPTVDIANLSPEERLHLLEHVWDSLSATPEAVPLTNAQRDELDRRLDDLDREGPTGLPWEKVRLVKAIPLPTGEGQVFHL